MRRRTHPILCSVCSVVQKLSLDGCEVTPTGVQHVASVLCNSVLTCNICRLNLSHNDTVRLL